MHIVIDMAAAYLFPFFIGFSLLWPLAQFLDPISHFFHQRCLSFAPDSTWKPAYQALVCGANFPAGPMFNSLKLTTLLHLAVVSGAHLLLLELIVRRIFNHLGINRGLIGVTLFDKPVRPIPTRSLMVRLSVTLLILKDKGLDSTIVTFENSSKGDKFSSTRFIFLLAQELTKNRAKTKRDNFIVNL